MINKRSGLTANFNFFLIFNIVFFVFNTVLLLRTQPLSQSQLNWNAFRSEKSVSAIKKRSPGVQTYKSTIFPYAYFKDIDVERDVIVDQSNQHNVYHRVEFSDEQVNQVLKKAGAPTLLLHKQDTELEHWFEKLPLNLRSGNYPEFIGEHYLLELYHCNRRTLSSGPKIADIISRAALFANATLVNLIYHEFPSSNNDPLLSDGGVTALALLSESHISVHTWPQFGYAAVDVFTCGSSVPARAALFIEKQFGADPYHSGWSSQPRGIPLVEAPDLFRDSAQLWERKSVVAATATEFQTSHVLDTSTFGRTLYIDGTLQSAEVDEALYHELLVHPAMLWSRALSQTGNGPSDVFVIGGGEGATLREVLKHSSVKKAYMCDLDEGVIAVSKKFLSMHHRGSFDNSRTILKVGDGIKFLDEKIDDQSLDVVVADLTDTVATSGRFISIAKRKLKPDTGVFVMQGGELDPYSTSSLKIFNRNLRKLKKEFGNAELYYETIPSFRGQWGFLICTLNSDPTLTRLSQYDPLQIQNLIKGSGLVQITPEQLHQQFSDWTSGFQKDLDSGFFAASKSYQQDPSQSQSLLHYSGNLHSRVFSPSFVIQNAMEQTTPDEIRGLTTSIRTGLPMRHADHFEVIEHH